MPNEGPNDRLLSKVDASRRDFVKRVLVGAAFTAPVVATFSIESLAVDSALAQDNFGSSGTFVQTPTVAGSYGCRLVDPGYVGPSQFAAHLVDISGDTRVNGECSFIIHPDPSVEVDLDMTRDAVVTVAYIAINGVNVANIPLQGYPLIQFADLHGVCDFDTLLQAMAAQQVSVVAQGTFAGASFNAQGTAQPEAAAGIIQLNP